MKTKLSAFDFNFDWRLWVCQFSGDSFIIFNWYVMALPEVIDTRDFFLPLLLLINQFKPIPSFFEQILHSTLMDNLQKLNLLVFSDKVFSISKKDFDIVNFVFFSNNIIFYLKLFTNMLIGIWLCIISFNNFVIINLSCFVLT